MQNEFDSVVNALEEYSPKNPEYEKEKINLLNNAEKFYDGREMIINAFKNTIFPFQHDESRFEDEDEDDIKDKNSLTDYKKLDRLIFLKEWDTNNELVRKTLQFKTWEHCWKNWKNKKNTEKKEAQVSLVRSGLRDLTDEIEQMGKDEKTWKTEWNSGYCSGYCIVILEFNEENQQGQGLKILTPDQMLSRLPITLAQLKAVNNL